MQQDCQRTHFIGNRWHLSPKNWLELIYLMIPLEHIEMQMEKLLTQKKS